MGRGRILLAAAVLAGLGLWPAASSRSASGPAYFMTLGSRVASFSAPPVVTQDGQRYVAAAVLDQLHPGPGTGARTAAPAPAPLGGRSAQVLPLAPPQAAESQRPGGGTDAGMPLLVNLLDSPGRNHVNAAQSGSTDIPLPGEHYNPDEDKPGFASDEDLPAPADEAAPQLLSAPAPSSIGQPRGGRKRYQLGAHALDLPVRGQPLAGELNGKALASGDLLDWNGQRYVKAALLQRLGLVLYFNSLDGCYALCGLVYRVEYNPQQRALALSSLVPLTVTGQQVDEQQLRLDVEGGFFASPKPTDIAGDPFIQRMSFKSQPQLGRGFVYLRQPRRSGYRASADKLNGYARVDFGNYFQLASYDLTSSGEISLNVELGAAAPLKTQQLDSPPRLVLDFAGVSYVDATQRIAINRGAARELRIGTPQDGTLRVVLELTAQRDYRVLTKEGGARYFVQLLPAAGGPGPGGSPAARAGRVIMLDAGHGGSDPGAPGVVANADEKDITLKICYLLKARLERLGYKVLMTRTDDRFVSLGARGDYANSALPYVFVSIHCNSIGQPDYAGAMTFHHDFAGPEAIRLAKDVQGALLASTGAVDKGVRKADFFVLRETVMPAILVETGFLTNKDECSRLLDPAYQAKVAAGVAAGIDQYVGGR